MNPEDIRIVVRDGKEVWLSDFFKEERTGRLEMAHLSFEEKVKNLIALQELARNWGGKKDVIVWPGAS